MRAFCRRPRCAARLLAIFFALLMLLASPGLVSAQTGDVVPHRVTFHPPRLPDASDATPSPAGADEAGLHDGLYVGRDFPFRVAFDSRVWTKTAEYDPEPGFEGFSIKSDITFGGIEADTDQDIVNDCLAASVTGLAAGDGFSNVHQAPDLEMPPSAPDADKTMFTFDLDGDNGPTSYTGYIECRDIVKGKSVLRIQLAATNDQFDAALPTWGPLLSGIEITASGSDSSADAAPTTTAGNDAADGDIENVVGNTYTSPRFGFSISWPETYTPTLAAYEAKDEADVLAVQHGRSNMVLQSSPIADYPVAHCFSFGESMIKENDKNTNVKLMTAKSGQPMRDVTETAAYATYSYTFNGPDGPADLVEHVRCQADPTGTFSLDFSFITPAESYAKTQKDLQAMIDSIRFA